MFSKYISKIKRAYFYRNYSKIYPYIAQYKVRVLVAIFVSVPIGILDAAIPGGLKYYIDGVNKGQGQSLVKFMPLFIVIFTLIQSVLTYVANYMNAWVGAKISNSLKYDLYKKLMRYSASFFDNNATGIIQMRFNADVDLACAQLLNNMKNFMKQVFNSVGYVGFLLYVSWKLAFVALVVLGFALFPLKNIRQRIQSISHNIMMAGSSIVSSYIEAFSGNRVITSYNLYAYQMKKFLTRLETSFNLAMKMVQRTGILSPVMHFVIGAGIAVIIFVGNYLMYKGEMTIGDFTAFITAVILLYQPIKGLGNDIASVQSSLLAIERVFELLDSTPDIVNTPKARKIISVKREIEYKDVSFDYGNGRPILKNINLKIHSGETIAFVGNSGGGKSTLVNLLPRFYDVTGGVISIDGVDIRKIDVDSLRAQIAVVFQDNFLFDGTILDNILLGRRNASQAEVQQAIQNACLSEFIGSLKKNVRTTVGERGILLSGGQKQRIAIARAFIKNAPIVILDEATSALDSKSESVVQQAIENLMKDRTVLIVAHRLSSVKNANKIVVINYGEIAEIGTHEELLSYDNGIYKSLYETQISQK